MPGRAAFSVCRHVLEIRACPRGKGGPPGGVLFVVGFVVSPGALLGSAPSHAVAALTPSAIAGVFRGDGRVRASWCH
eukprot:7454360-Lingulodinium_polyedra.AAC.1